VALTAPERETIIGFSDGEDIAQVYTAQRPVITRLKKNPAAVLADEGVYEGSPWARFTIPASLISFRSAARHADLTDEQRDALRERARRNFSSPGKSENSTLLSENEEEPGFRVAGTSLGDCEPRGDDDAAAG
jgi:pimeloyl-ACP methyl ester carboxylesterase